MTSIVVLGATGNLGQHVAREALARDWSLVVAVRSRHRLVPGIVERAQVTDIDLGTASPGELAALADGRDACICCAGVVTEGNRFVFLIDRVVTALETIPVHRRPVCWFLAGAALLPIDASGRVGLDLPRVRDTYWPHRINHQRLVRSTLDWQLLCPGPMVDQPAIGLERLRISIEGLPSPLPAITQSLPAALVLPLFAMKIPEMIVPYADAAAVMLANVHRDSPMSRKRVGIALPVGMRGRKDEWATRPRGASA